MRDKIVKDLLMEAINMAMIKYTFEIIGYSIIDNHFHFIIRTLEREETISRIMQFIKSQMAQRYNKKMKRTGPFWNERFKDYIIEHANDPEYYLLWLLWYLAYNPVRKGYVLNPRKFAYSSINAYLERDYISPIKITLHSYFLKLGQTFEERIKSFLHYEEIYLKRLALMFF
jgi:REP element-mobilizing transposase RayT